jgi:hypothetical protein
MKKNTPKKVVSNLEKAGFDMLRDNFTLDKIDEKYLDSELQKKCGIIIGRLDKQEFKILFYKYKDNTDSLPIVKHKNPEYNGFRIKVKPLSRKSYSREFLIESKSGFNAFLAYLQ